MGRVSALLPALVLGGACALALASCGGSNAKLLPGAKASQIEANLDEVRQLVAGGDCIGAENTVAAVSTEVEELNEVAPKLKAALEEGTARLGEVVGRCEEETSEESEPSPERAVEEEELETQEREAEEKAQERAEKQQLKEEEKAEAPEKEEGELPPQSEGKGKAKGHEEAPPPAPAPEGPAESESGGVSPGVGVE